MSETVSQVVAVSGAVSQQATVDEADPSNARRRRWWPGRTLRGRLTVAMVAVLLMACAVLGVATALFLRSFLVGRLDAQLSSAGGRYSASLEQGSAANDRDADNAIPGQSVGTLGVRMVAGTVSQAAVVRDDGTNRTVTFSASDIAQLRAVAISPGPRSAHLDAVGEYRLQAEPGRDGDVQITGLPLHPIDDTLARLVAIEAALFAVLVVTGGLTTAVVVRRTLRPLQKVSATALQVSELPLTDAATPLPKSIAPAEPTSEVDQVSVAFDHMLDHVRNALVARDETEARLRRFVADASHELRTPLATIRAYAEYAARPGDEPLPASTAEALGRISVAADRMGALVADLLLLARLDAGRPLLRESVDVTRLVLDAVTDARTADQTHRWRLDLPEDVVTVTGDPDRLHQVVANLLSNARTHTPPGTTVTAALQATAAGVEVSVSDDGPGIPADQLTGLFDRFTRGDTSRSRAHGSTGLGLAIAHGIALAHHGTLTVSSDPGCGARFRLLLPHD